MTIFIWTILFVFIILLCVTFHEFGHFIIAILFKTRVHEFAIGFGPRIFKFKRKNMIISIRILPLGGYVFPASHELSKELFPEDEVQDGQYMEDRKAWQRICFILGGILFNFIFALFFSLFFFLIDSTTISYGKFLSQSFLLIIEAISKIFVGDFSNTSSIPGEIKHLANQSQWGITVFSLLVSININLAIFNIIPFPPLDGWRLVELTYEKIFHKPIPINVRTVFALIGTILLLGFSIFLIIRDFI